MAQKIGIVVMMPSEARVRNTRARGMLLAGVCTMATSPRAPQERRDRAMPAAFQLQVGMPADHDHPDSGDAIGNDRQHADMQWVLNTHLLDESRQPETDDVNAADEAEIGEGEHIDFRVLERF